MKTEISAITELLQNLPCTPIISIAGAGGKTTLMYRLANYLPGPTVLTTTTRVGEEQIKDTDHQYAINDFPPQEPEKRMWVSPSLIPVKGKIIGCDTSDFSRIAKICMKNAWALINEADGAARRHIKAPAEFEPVIPKETNVCIYSVGLDVLGNPVNSEFVHRQEIFSNITGYDVGEFIDAECIIRLYEHPEVGLKNMPEHALKIAYMSHANTETRCKNAEYIVGRLKSYDFVYVNE